MDWIDLVLGGYLVVGALYGLRRGLIWVGFSLLGYVAGVVVAEHVSRQVTSIITAAAPIHRWVERYLPTPASAIPGARLEAWHMAQALIGLLVFLLIIGALEFVGRTIGAVLTQGVRVFRLTSLLNRIGGVIVGVLEHGVVAGLVLTLLFSLPAVARSNFGHAIHHAPLAGTVMGIFRHLGKIPGARYL